MLPSAIPDVARHLLTALPHALSGIGTPQLSEGRINIEGHQRKSHLSDFGQNPSDGGGAAYSMPLTEM